MSHKVNGRKLSVEKIESVNEMGEASTSEQNLLSPIFKLNIDCCNEIFEYLTLEDLCSLGKTCKSMQNVTGEYFKIKFKFTDKYITKDDRIFTYHYGSGDVTVFTKFINKLRFKEDQTEVIQDNEMEISQDLDDFVQFEDTFRGFKSLNQMMIKDQVIYTGLYKNILPQLEIIKLNLMFSSIVGNFYEDFLKFCVNLKELHITNMKVGNWINRTYPKLSVFHFIPIEDYFNFDDINMEITELCLFLKRHTGIKTFSTDAICLLENQENILELKLKLDTLKIHDSNAYNIQPLCTLLKELYERGFYKRLHLEMDCSRQEVLDNFASLDALESLIFKSFGKDCKLTQISSLKDLLFVGRFHHEIQSEVISLMNLEHLVLHTATFDNLMQFARELVKLMKIKVDNFGGEHKLDLIKLNKEREKLFGARKITIFIEEKTFLNTKWTTPNGDTNFSFIELKRRYAQ